MHFINFKKVWITKVNKLTITSKDNVIKLKLLFFESWLIAIDNFFLDQYIFNKIDKFY